MILGLASLVFSAGVTPPDLVQKVGPSSFDVSSRIKAQLEQRSRMDQVQPVVAVSEPVEVAKLFSHYPGFEVSAALINRALDPKHWVAQGAQFDPQYNQKLEQTVTQPFLRDRGIKEVLAVGVSDYAGSTRRRLVNMKASIAQLDGYIIPQGETFSFNQVLGEVTEEKGYVWARVLRNSKNAWGLGGGVCQVSTNVFRAALNAGLEITDRRAHSIAIDKYAPTGLDATIFIGYQDLQFVNNTPGDVLMKFVMRDDKLVTVLYGTKDHRLITLEKTKHWEGYDGRLATEWTRTVTRGEQARIDVFNSNYRPVAPVETASE